MISKTQRNIALVEIGGSHDECLLSQLYALRSINCRITLVTTKEIIDRNSLFYELVDAVHLVHFPKKAIGDYLLMRNLNRYLHLNGIEKVILNTAQGGHIRNLCFTSFRKMEFVGIIHTLKKFQGSFTQKLINKKIKKYLVLNDFFLEKIVQQPGIQIESFYPLRFPTFDQEVKKKDSEIWITIIGGLENRRKDLEGSIALMKKVEDLPLRFIFLGKSDANKNEVIDFTNELKKQNLFDKVKIFHSFVPEAEFDAYLKKTDIIWPMVHPDTPSAQEYFKNQISGAMNVSFGYKIPLFIHKDYKTEWKDLNNAFAYSLKSFKGDLQHALNNLESTKIKLIETNKFTPEFQEKKYLNFIFPERNN